MPGIGREIQGGCLAVAVIKVRGGVDGRIPASVTSSMSLEVRIKIWQPKAKAVISVRPCA